VVGRQLDVAQDEPARASSSRVRASSTLPASGTRWNIDSSIAARPEQDAHEAGRQLAVGLDLERVREAGLVQAAVQAAQARR
jgi:hypothetical protein